MDPETNTVLDAIFQDAIEFLEEARRDISDSIALGANAMINTLLAGGKILACGNGGSAADVLHFTGEMLNRFLRERPPLPAIALNADVATMTAIANDYSFSEVFSKQVKALGAPGDLLFVITTSGNSSNLPPAVKTAQDQGLKVVVLSGRDGGALAGFLRSDSDIEIRIRGSSTPRIQEVQQLVIHCLCELIDNHLLGNN